MKSLPHDYYLRFVDGQVYDDVLFFHSKANYVIHKAYSDHANLHFLDQEQLKLLTGNELPLYPDMDLTIDIKFSDEHRNASLFRQESCERFSPVPLDFADVQSLMYPLLSRSRDSFKRGYPSGGALYPAEIFVCSLTEGDSTWPAPGKILHLLPQSRKFEVMQVDLDKQALNAALLAASVDIGHPSIAVVYAAYMPKNIFKYRYRGYRMALMEIGSIYMLVELQAKSLGLACRLWSAYTDSMLCRVIGLNPAMFFPMCVHLIGKQHEDH